MRLTDHITIADGVGRIHCSAVTASPNAGSSGARSVGHHDDDLPSIIDPLHHIRRARF